FLSAYCRAPNRNVRGDFFLKNGLNKKQARIHLVQTVFGGIMTSKSKKAIIFPALLLAAFLTGCEILDDFSEQIDPPQTVTYTEDEEAEKGKEDKKGNSDKNSDAVKEKTVMTELYLIDKNGYVVPRTMALP